ncbi:hypothetical protein B0T16DRAFT_455640 [Cercophora newfieldiana]|uniref:Ankyrin repeat protein n=1 Tax=Cercophora newfieldiana TaxID=92897 RepID=A0AA39Y9E1_9PEZI|nr:hypothetical protein B0T16DRAFT_455640 [Cercophora newfieldiana]
MADVLIRHRQVQEDEAHWDEVIDRLCWLTLDCSQSGKEIQHGGVQRSVHHQEPNLGLSILSAATYFGYASLVRQLLDEGHDPTLNDYLFPAAMYIATRIGRPDMLLLLQQYLPLWDEPRPGDWRSKSAPSLSTEPALEET